MLMAEAQFGSPHSKDSLILPIDPNSDPKKTSPRFPKTLKLFQWQNPFEFKPSDIYGVFEFLIPKSKIPGGAFHDTMCGIHDTEKI